MSKQVERELPVRMALAVVGLSIVLSGCFPLAAAGVASGTLAATDRRSIGTQLDDRSIQLKVANRLSNRFGEAASVSTTVYGRRVLLSGEVADESVKQAVEAEASRIEGVRLIVNEVAVMPKASVSSRSNDTLLTTKVKASLVEAQDVFANAFKVTTERGTVYLMGRVSEREAKRAAEIAAAVPGVSRVVKITDIISEEELKGLMATPSAEPSASNPRP